MTPRGPRLACAVGAFLLLALASLLVLALASTNGKFSFGNAGTYELKARFTNIGPGHRRPLQGPARRHFGRHSDRRPAGRELHRPAAGR